MLKTLRGLALGSALIALAACGSPDAPSSSETQGAGAPANGAFAALKINTEAPSPQPPRPHSEAFGIKAGDAYSLHIKDLDEALASPGRYEVTDTPSDPRFDHVSLSFDQATGKVCGVFTRTHDAGAAQDYIDRFTTDYGPPVRDDHGLTWRVGDQEAFMGLFPDADMATIGWHFTPTCAQDA